MPVMISTAVYQAFESGNIHLELTDFRKNVKFSINRNWTESFDFEVHFVMNRFAFISHFTHPLVRHPQRRIYPTLVWETLLQNFWVMIVVGN